MTLSIIIPALNEEKSIESTLENLLAHHKPDEVIVIDGGSHDETVRIASRYAKVISAKPGRARQMNEGARHARGDIFLFLHADTQLPERGLDFIREAIEIGGAKAGRFRLAFDHPSPWLAFYASYTRFHFFSYGDQAFFVTRDLFWEIGGFREDVPFEDIDFYKRLRQVTRPVIIPAPVTTSARRFLRVGCLRQKLINLYLVSLYYLGFNISPFKRRLYSDVR